MRIVLSENCTVDGVIDMAAGWFDPAEQSDDLVEELRRNMLEEDALLLGRKTFESFRDYWPHQHDDTTGIRDHLNQVHKYVVSSTLDDPGWENTTVLRRSPVEEVRDLRDRPGRDLAVGGSISVAHQLVAADLLDEYRLFVHPLTVGSGARLFADGSPPLALRLVDCRSFESGVALLRYRRSGAAQ